jgi:Domain of unknown function (DUF4388)
MSTIASPRLEPFAVPGGLRGTLGALPLPELLRELSLARATGILSLTHNRARKAIYLSDGRVVFATSNIMSDRLGEVLLREGKITPEQNELSIRALDRGKRQGRVLVEMAALSPADLWSGVQAQVREIAFSMFRWSEGQFHFEESEQPARERITVDLDVTAIVLEGMRSLDAGGWVGARHPEGHLVLEPGEAPREGLLLPYEEHVHRLVDGERSVIEICHESEIGDNETLKLLYAFLATGIVRAKGRKVQALDQDFVPADTTYDVLESFNRMYRFVLAYLVKEVGPIAESVLAKYLSTIRESRADVLQGVALRPDGSLEEAVLERNVGRLPEERRRDALVGALNELLYAELLAVKRTLGAEHESAIIRALRPR